MYKVSNEYVAKLVKKGIKPNMKINTKEDFEELLISKNIFYDPEYALLVCDYIEIMYIKHGEDIIEYLNGIVILSVLYVNRNRGYISYDDIFLSLGSILNKIYKAETILFGQIVTNYINMLNKN